MLPCPFVGIYSGEKSHQFLHETWIILLSKSVETFFMVSISDMPNIRYCKILQGMMDKVTENIPKQCRIGDACFMSLATFGGNLCTRHPKNINRVHKDSNNFLSVIIIMRTNAHGGETLSYDGEKMD